MTMCHDDETLDLDAVRADDALLDAIAAGARPNDPLAEVLAAIAGSAYETHLLPLGRSMVTGCCGRPLDEVPGIDTFTDDDDDVVCTARRS